VASCRLTKFVPNYLPFRRGVFDLISFARFLFVISLLAASLLPAAEQTSLDSTTAAADELKALRDQTIIESRVWLDTEWDQFKHGAEEARWTLGRLWGWHVSDRQDWAVRA
jgi:hypothetical protein